MRRLDGAFVRRLVKLQEESGAAAALQNVHPPNWYETFFHGVTLDLWRRAIPPEQTTAEAEFLIQNLNCEPGAHVLDVPCGNGRLTFELANRGYRVTGIDLAEEFIEEARSPRN